jgi:CDP-4-dehydro-6-deoxyglucose reductase
VPTVKLLPGGEQFAVEGEDSILDAALFAGLAMPYGCSAGNCGLCRARVVSGSLRQVRHSDFRLSEAERAQGYALMCCAAPLGELLIEASLAHGAAEIPRQRVNAHVRNKELLSPQVMLLELLTSRASRLRFLAGQGARLEAGGLTTSLPIASCPCEERRLQFHVCRAPGDAFAAHVFDALRPGEQVTVEGPHGDFVLREDGERPLVFVAFGREGFAPVKSVIEHAMSLEAQRPIELYWIAAHAGELYQANLCRAWADAMDQFRFAPIVSSPAPQAALAAALDPGAELSARDFYLAGGAAAVAGARGWLLERGLPARQLIEWSPG